MLSGANYVNCKIQPPPQHGTTRVAFCIGLKRETLNLKLQRIAHHAFGLLQLLLQEAHMLC